MITLTINARDKEELLDYFDKLKGLIQEGYTSGTLLDGWDLEERKTEK